MLRVILAAVFVLSALSKLMPASIDQFELYVFSFGFFSLDCSYILARLCIGAELVLALLLFVGWFPRITRLASLGLLILFSLFLCYAVLIGRDDSCQCFGQLMDINPAQSLLKNAVLVALLLVYFKGATKAGSRRVWKVVVSLVAAALLMAAPFVVSVPDNWGFGPQQIRYDEAVFADATAPDGALRSLGVGEGRKLVAFVIPKCPYCKLARQRIDAIADRNHIDKKNIIYIEPQTISTELFLAISHGSPPLVMLLDGQTVKATYHSRNIDEKEITEFLIY